MRTTFLIALLLPVSFAQSDVVILTNGDEIEGTVTSEEGDQIVIESDGVELKFARSKVEEVIRDDETGVAVIDSGDIDIEADPDEDKEPVDSTDDPDDPEPVDWDDDDTGGGDSSSVNINEYADDKLKHGDIRWRVYSRDGGSDMLTVAPEEKSDYWEVTKLTCKRDGQTTVYWTNGKTTHSTTTWAERWVWSGSKWMSVKDLEDKSPDTYKRLLARAQEQHKAVKKVLNRMDIMREHIRQEGVQAGYLRQLEDEKVSEREKGFIRNKLASSKKYQNKLLGYAREGKNTVGYDALKAPNNLSSCMLARKELMSLNARISGQNGIQVKIHRTKIRAFKDRLERQKKLMEEAFERLKSVAARY